MDDIEESADESRSVEDTSAKASVDDLLSALAHPRRRLAIHCLHGRGEPMSLEAVAEAVAGLEGRPETGEIADGELETVLVALHHRHLPTLERAGIVEYDPESNVVVLAEDAASVESLLDVVGE